LIFDDFIENLPGKFYFHYNLARVTGVLREDDYAVLIVSRPVFLRLRSASDKICGENRNTFFDQ
jgi:hypothetical protein